MCIASFTDIPSRRMKDGGKVWVATLRKTV